MNKSLVTSDEPVDVKLLNGTLTSNKMQISTAARWCASRAMW
jgi:hypothetical protein